MIEANTPMSSMEVRTMLGPILFRASTHDYEVRRYLIVEWYKPRLTLFAEVETRDTAETESDPSSH